MNLNFNGKEKAVVPAGASIALALPTFVQAGMALFGLMDPPSPEELKEAITLVLFGFGLSMGVWQVPNSKVEE